MKPVLLSVFICVCLWPANGAVDYTKFSHSTPKHKSTCNTCHKVPTKSWSKVSAFPDVTDFPDHDACVSCHRVQFFKSARPPICSVCHSKTSPRDEARYVLLFEIRKDMLFREVIRIIENRRVGAALRLRRATVVLICRNVRGFDLAIG